MAINPETEFVGKIAPATTEFPYGSARDITLTGDGAGTPWKAVLVNDIFGMQQELLVEAGIVPSGTPDEVGDSQYVDAMKIVCGQIVPDKAAAVLLTPNVNATLVIRSADGRGSTWRAVTGAAPATYSDNGGTALGTMFIPTGGDGSAAWLRNYEGALYPSWFGAVGDGVADDTAAFLAVIAATPAGGTIKVPVGNYLLTSTIDINKPGTMFIGTGHSYSGASFSIDHLTGPGFRVSATHCYLSDLKVAGSATRTAGAAGSGLTGNYGILYEGADAASTFITKQVCNRVQSNGHPNIGVLSSGHVWYSLFTQLNVTGNGGQGFLADAGETTGRTNLDYNGFSTITYLTSAGNGGEGLAIGTPTQLNVDQALRMKVDNYDGGDNATDAGVRFSTHDSYVIGTNHIIEQSAWAGVLGAIKIMGDNIELRNNRLVGGLTSGITVDVPPYDGTTDGAVIDRLRVNTTAPLDPVIDITGSLVRYTDIRQRSNANVTNLVRDLGDGTRIDRYTALGYTQVATYDFAVDGGAIGKIGLSGRIPPGATITHAWYEVLTPPTSGGAATLSFGVDANDPTGLLAATAIAGFTAGYGDLLPDNTAANFTTKTTNPRDIIMTIAAAALTDGKINVFYTYSVSP